MFVLAVVSVGVFAGACPKPEAQMTSATIKSVKPTGFAGVCEVKFSGLVTESNPFCPLDTDTILGATVLTQECGLKPGQQISRSVIVLEKDGTVRF